MSELGVMRWWVKELRSRTGLTQDALAGKIGLKQNSVALIEMGRRCPSRSVVLLMEQLAIETGLPPAPACEIAAADAAGVGGARGRAD